MHAFCIFCGKINWLIFYNLFGQQGHLDNDPFMDFSEFNFDKFNKRRLGVLT